jgi:hypothetical protein
MTRRRAYRDPTAERASLSNIGHALNSITDRREVGMVIFIVIWGLSVPEAARRMRTSEQEAWRLFGRAVGRLRHPSHGGLDRELHELDDGFVARSGELRRWAQAAAQALVTACPLCGRKFLPESIFYVTGGRPRQYCSNACRQASYRARRRRRAGASGGGG